MDYIWIIHIWIIYGLHLDYIWIIYGIYIYIYIMDCIWIIYVYMDYIYIWIICMVWINVWIVYVLYMYVCVYIYNGISYESVGSMENPILDYTWIISIKVLHMVTESSFTDCHLPSALAQ